MPSQPINRRNAFTLVELLVVLAIISMLIAILLPAMIGVKKKAQAVACAANLRSVGMAMAHYTNRYGAYPGWCIYDTRRYSIWQVRLREFTNGEQRVFDCPAQDNQFWWDRVAPDPGAPDRATDVHARCGYEVGEPLLDADQRPLSYGYNAFGAGPGYGNAHERQKGLGSMFVVNPTPGEDLPREVRASRVRKPAQMIAVTDTGDGLADSAVLPNPSLPWGRPGTIHNRGANVLFCDGHVQWYPQKSLLVTYNTYVESEAPIRRMWNNDHKVNAGIAYDREDGG